MGKSLYLSSVLWGMVSKENKSYMCKSLQCNDISKYKVKTVERDISYYNTCMYHTYTHIFGNMVYLQRLM